jgi:methionine-rich copper-binding protein CopC
MRIRNWTALPAMAGLVFGTGMLHNHLVKSDPAADAKVAASPAQIKLWFAEKPEIPFTSITLMKSDSTRIATLRAVATDDTMAVAIPLGTTTLAPGDYLVGWRSASSDGHAIRGTFRFSISP